MVLARLGSASGSAWGWLLGVCIDFGLVSVGSGWLSLTRILIGFGVDLGLISGGSWLDFGLDFALSLAFTRIVIHSSLS